MITALTHKLKMSFLTGDFSPIYRDTEMVKQTNAGGQTKGANEKSIVYHLPA